VAVPVEHQPSNVVFMGRFVLLRSGTVIEPIPPQLGLDPGDNLQGIERLCDVVVGPDGQSHDLVPVRRPGCEHDDGTIGLLPDFLAELKTVCVGEHHVQERQIQGCVFNTVQGLCASIALVDRVAVICEVKLQHVGQLLFIVNYQDACEVIHSVCHFTSAPFFSCKCQQWCWQHSAR
jgi:hypothetical protein